MRCLNCNRSFRGKRADALFCEARCRVAYSRKRNRNVTDKGQMRLNSEKTILSLCDHSGTWSEPYSQAGYNVIRVDLKHGQDVRLMTVPDIPVHGVLAAPPCTCFAVSGNRWKRSDADMTEALSVADACIRLVTACNPVWWALENPVGKLRRYLGEPAFYFDPCDFGDYGEAYTKRTCLWGRFTSPKPRNRLRPVNPKSGHHSQDAFILSQGKTLGRNDKKSSVRSVTPKGFAQAFFEANP